MERPRNYSVGLYTEAGGGIFMENDHSRRVLMGLGLGVAVFFMGV